MRELSGVLDRRGTKKVARVMDTYAVGREAAECWACGDLGFMRSADTAKLVLCPACNQNGARFWEIAKLTEELKGLLEAVGIAQMPMGKVARVCRFCGSRIWQLGSLGHWSTGRGMKQFYCEKSKVSHAHEPLPEKTGRVRKKIRRR